MPAMFVTGSFLPGTCVPNPTQEQVDSGLPEWTLGADGLPPAEPTEHDGDDAGISGDDQADNGYDADDEDNDNDHADFAEAYEHLLSTLPVDNAPVPDETGDEGTSADDSYIEDYEYFLSTGPVDNPPVLDVTSSDAQPPSLETDSGTWTASSDAASTDFDSDEIFNAQVDARVAIRRPPTPDLHDAFSGLTMNAHNGRRRRTHRPRSRTQIPGPGFQIHVDADGESDFQDPTLEAEQPALWESARPTNDHFHIIAHHMTLGHATPEHHRVHMPPMAPLPNPLSSYSTDDFHHIATLDLNRIIENHVPRHVNLFMINDPPDEIHAIVADDLQRVAARRRAMGEFMPIRRILGEVGGRDYRRNDADAGLVVWVEEVRGLMEWEESRGTLEYNRRMWSADGYVSDENDPPDE